MKAELMRWMAAIIMVTTYIGLIVTRPENAGIILVITMIITLGMAILPSEENEKGRGETQKKN